MMLAPIELDQTVDPALSNSVVDQIRRTQLRWIGLFGCAMCCIVLVGANWQETEKLPAIADTAKTQDWWYEVFPSVKGDKSLYVQGPHTLRHVDMPTVIFQAISLEGREVTNKVCFVIVVNEQHAFRALTSNSQGMAGKNITTYCQVMGTQLPRSCFVYTFGYFDEITEEAEWQYASGDLLESRPLDLTKGRVFVLEYDESTQSQIMHQHDVVLFTEDEFKRFGNSTGQERVQMIQRWWAENGMELQTR